MQQWNVFSIPVRLRNRLLSTGLEPVLSQTEKSCIASNYRQFSTNVKIKIGAKKRINLHFDIREMLSIIRCDKYMLIELAIIICWLIISVKLNCDKIDFLDNQNSKVWFQGCGAEVLRLQTRLWSQQGDWSGCLFSFELQRCRQKETAALYSGDMKQ